jgi:hypothetical protein
MDPRLTHGATVRGKRQGHSLSRARAHSRYVTFLGTNSAVGTKLGTSRLVNQRDSHGAVARARVTGAPTMVVCSGEL